MSESGRRPSALAAVLVAAGLLLLAGGSPAPAAELMDKPAPFVLITKDGHRVDAVARPEREGGKVRVRLFPRETLAVLSEDAIDWEATERYNAPRPKAAPKRAPISTAEGARSIASVAGAVHGEPIEMTIIGGKSRMTAVAEEDEEEAGEGAGEVSGEAQAAPAAPAGEEAVEARLNELRKQMAAAKATYDQTVRARDSLLARRAELQQKVDLEPRPNPDQDYLSPSRRALQQVEEQLAGAEEEIRVLEGRMNDIRFGAVQLGGSVD